jgi:hypothetical protein
MWPVQEEEMSTPLKLKHLAGSTAVPIVLARWEPDWDTERGHDLLIVDKCPWCPHPHYYSPEQFERETGADRLTHSHCRDNRRRDRADRRYLMLDRGEARARARAAMRAFLAASLDLSAPELDTVMTRGFEALWTDEVSAAPG